MLALLLRSARLLQRFFLLLVRRVSALRIYPLFGTLRNIFSTACPLSLEGLNFAKYQRVPPTKFLPIVGQKMDRDFFWYPFYSYQKFSKMQTPKIFEVFFQGEHNFFSENKTQKFSKAQKSCIFVMLFCLWSHLRAFAACKTKNWHKNDDTSLWFIQIFSVQLMSIASSELFSAYFDTRIVEMARVNLFVISVCKWQVKLPLKAKKISECNGCLPFPQVNPRNLRTQVTYAKFWLCVT